MGAIPFDYLLKYQFCVLVTFQVGKVRSLERVVMVLLLMTGNFTYNSIILLDTTSRGNVCALIIHQSFVLISHFVIFVILLENNSGCVVLRKPICNCKSTNLKYTTYNFVL